jgi:ABC-type nitrate/sulfonate/bicarbonate transport system substrate-binding protein
MAAVRLALLACAAALALAGCGGDQGREPGGAVRPGRPATLLLDFTPNAVHAGIYAAAARGFDSDEGVALRIRTPSASTDALKLLQARRADLAILDIHDLGLARQAGADLVGVMALVQRPLAAVLAQPGIRSPRDLEGERAGVTGLPSDRAVLRSVVAGAGGDPDRVRATTIGFEAVKALLARRVDAATAFWNVEGVALERRRPGIREFRVDDYGAPAYPELVLCVTRRTLRERLDLVRGTIRALRRGYQATVADPSRAIDGMVKAEPDLDRVALRRQLAAVSPALVAKGRPYGGFDPVTLRAWAAWDVRFGILRRRPDVERAFDLHAAD